MKSQRTLSAEWTGTLTAAVGALWLGGSATTGIPQFCIALLPGALLLCGGVGRLLLPEDLRAPRLGGVGALLGTLLGLPALLWLPWPLAAALCGLSALAFVGAGRAAADSDPTDGRAPGTFEILGAALDETLLAVQPCLEPPLPRVLRDAAVAEGREALALFDREGWSTSPRTYHAVPPPLVDPSLEAQHAGPRRHEALTFPSEYVPHASEPGRARWLDYEENRTARARIVRSAGEPRPWVVCLHGSRAGTDGDLRVFGPLSEALRVNIAMPVLPLHGPRRQGRRSGDGFVGRWELDFVHAIAQSVWDVRRLITWIRTQPGGDRVSLFGISLGGYTAALLSCIETDLAAVLAALPASDFAALDRRAATPVRHTNAGGRDLAWTEVEALYDVVSPLAIPTLQPVEHLRLIAATQDRFLPREQTERLRQHWGSPRLDWIPGGHITALFTSASRRAIGGFLSQA